MVKLGVNIDHIATIRQQRKGKTPNLLAAARICEKNGANGITVHLREDRRHIQDKDVFELKKKIKTRLNLEMSIAEEIVRVALNVKPYTVCLVPEKRQELTTEGGLDVVRYKNRIKNVVRRMHSKKIKVSLFVDPDLKQVAASKDVGADYIEIHTGSYAEAFEADGSLSKKAKKELEKIRISSKRALNQGLTLNAGHGLDLKNVGYIAKIPGMNEFNIGFSIIARSVFVGLGQAVREMKKAISSRVH